MKVVCTVNGTLQIHLEPENAVERAIVEVIVERSQKGSVVQVGPSFGMDGMCLTMPE